MKITELKINPRNPQRFSDEAIETLMNSIKTFPKMLTLRKIIYDPKTMYILGGNKRLICLQKLGYKEIPDNWVKSADELTEEEKKRFAVQDNIQIGDWNFELLDEDYEHEELEEWGLDFGEFEEEPVDVKEDNYEIPEEIKTDIKDGDLIEIGEHRLMCGDSTDGEQVAKLMNGEKADLVFTDPPYNVDYSSKNELLNLYDKGNRIQTEIKNDNFIDKNEYTNWIAKWFNNIVKYLNDYNSIYICGNYETLISFYDFEELKISNILVWVKNAMVLGRMDYKCQHENILYGWINHHKWYGENNATTTWFIDKPLVSKLHPTMKPIELCNIAINNSSKKKMIILDVFLGSGSTMVASHQLNRKCYGMEIDPHYCQVIVDRMLKLDNTLEVKINGKEYKKIDN